MNILIIIQHKYKKLINSSHSFKVENKYFDFVCRIYNDNNNNNVIYLLGFNLWQTYETGQGFFYP